MMMDKRNRLVYGKLGLIAEAMARDEWHERLRQWKLAKVRERNREYHRALRKANPDKVREYQREYKRKRRQGPLAKLGAGQYANQTIDQVYVGVEG